MAERSFVQGSRKAAPGRRRGIFRRRHSRHHQGAAAMRRRLCRRLSGRADQPSDGRAGRRAGHSGRAWRAFRGERLGSHRHRHAGGLGALPDPRCRHLQVHRRHQRRLRRAGQPRVRRRHRRRADHRRRGLWRRLLHHAGAQPCLRHEEPGVAARPAPEPAFDRQGGGGRFRAVGSLEHAGHAAGAHSLLPRAWQFHRQGQQAPGDDRGRRAREPAPRHRPHRAAARLLHPREGKDRQALAGGGRLHPLAQDQRVLRPRHGQGRHRLPGRHVQFRHARAGAHRPCRHLWRDGSADLCAQRRLSADRRRVPGLLRGQGRRARGGGRPAELHRAGFWQHAAQGRARHQASSARNICRSPANIPAR